MASFSFRLRFHLRDDTHINHESEDLTIVEGEEGFRVRLKSGELGVPIKDRSRAALIGGPYPSEQSAGQAADAAKRALLVWAVTQRVGIDIGDGKLRSVVTEYGLKMFEDKYGGPIRNDVHGIDVYSDDADVKFVSINPRLLLGKSVTNFVDTVSAQMRSPLPLTEKQIVATELYCSSFFDVSFRSKLITLISSVEALLDPPQRASDSVALVDELESMVLQSGIEARTKQAMRGSLQWLRKESIGWTGKSLSEHLLPDKRFMGKSPAEFFGYCYDLRSQIIHNGCVTSKSIDLLEVVTVCQEYVGELLVKSFEGQEKSQKLSRS